MPSRKYENSEYEKERARKILRAFYRKHYGETLNLIRMKDVGWTRRKSGYLYEVKDWEPSMRLVRLATIQKSSGHSLISFDVIIDAHGMGRDEIVQLCEWCKADKTTVAMHSAQGKFGVTRFWQDETFTGLSLSR